MDAVGMYSNIDQEHCLMVLCGYLTNNLVSFELNLHHCQHAIFNAIEILFKYNVSRFGQGFLLQGQTDRQTNYNLDGTDQRAGQ
jgi:hypothetical protein